MESEQASFIDGRIWERPKVSRGEPDRSYYYNMPQRLLCGVFKLKVNSSRTPGGIEKIGHASYELTLDCGHLGTPWVVGSL